MRGQPCARLSLLTAAWLLCLTGAPTTSRATNLVLQATQYLQAGGSTNFDTLACCSWGQYSLLSGTLQCDTLQLGAGGDGGTFDQTGGNFSVSNVVMTSWERSVDQGYGQLSVNGGIVQAGTISVGDSASCNQSAGGLTVSSLLLVGQVDADYEGEWPGYAWYRLTNGVLAVGTETFSIGNFLQEGGTNTVAGSLVLAGDVYSGPGRAYGSQYRLDGGVLCATNIVVGGCSVFSCGAGSSGGIENDGTFSLAGTLVVTDSRHQLGVFDVVPGALSLTTDDFSGQRQLLELPGQPLRELEYQCPPHHRCLGRPGGGWRAQPVDFWRRPAGTDPEAVGPNPFQ